MIDVLKSEFRVSHTASAEQKLYQAIFNDYLICNFIPTYFLSLLRSKKYIIA